MTHQYIVAGIGTQRSNTDEYFYGKPCRNACLSAGRHYAFWARNSDTYTPPNSFWVSVTMLSRAAARSLGRTVAFDPGAGAGAGGTLSCWGAT
ncbi:hypothetical protein [Corynebacterium rouxii]|uniref:hypothetical protein n=1 Tax=Corynebacterium rouxii TaxID=2719119 RepID=UPI0028EA7C74|nr:hypothetical protein [Corynebacterium rouxii]